MDTLKKQTNRRSGSRKPARHSVRLHCRRGSMGLGPDLAIQFLDISQGGLQLILKEAVRSGDEVEVVIDGHGMRAPIRRLADVRWVVPMEAGGCCAGVRFQKLLDYRDVQNLSQP